MSLLISEEGKKKGFKSISEISIHQFNRDFQKVEEIGREKKERKKTQRVEPIPNPEIGSVTLDENKQWTEVEVLSAPSFS